MIRAGDFAMQSDHAHPCDANLFTTKDVNRLVEMCVLFAWRRRCRVAKIGVLKDEHWGYTTARIAIR